VFGRYLPAFFIQTFRSARQAKKAAGSLAVCALRDTNCVFWTCTVWSEEAAMRSFTIWGHSWGPQLERILRNSLIDFSNPDNR
jgi:hypothetical protein